MEANLPVTVSVREGQLPSWTHAVNGSPARPDLPTAFAIGSLALISTMLLHEGLGHGGVCAALGGRMVLYPVSMQCSVQSRAMVAAGPLVNFVIGGGLWVVLRCARRLPLHLEYFLWLLAAFNLFNAAGYLCLGALTGFGDWAVLLKETNPAWVIRICLALLAGSLYYGFMHAVASVGSAFLGPVRGWRLTLSPYFASGVAACGAALLSRLGSAYLAVAVAASFGANLGLLGIHDWVRPVGSDSKAPVMTPSAGWIIGSSVGTVLFFAVIGRGLSL